MTTTLQPFEFITKKLPRTDIRTDPTALRELATTVGELWEAHLADQGLAATASDLTMAPVIDEETAGTDQWRIKVTGLAAPIQEVIDANRDAAPEYVARLTALMEARA